jgi:hypothetical protein
MALTCLIHVGMKWLTPDEDSGLGIEVEYQEAVRLHGGDGSAWRQTGAELRQAMATNQRRDRPSHDS